MLELNFPSRLDTGDGLDRRPNPFKSSHSEESILPVVSRDLDFEQSKQSIRTLEHRGDLLAAYDLAKQAIACFPDNTWFGHRAVLNLARSGATRQAQKLFDGLQLGDCHDNDEIVALQARLVKDEAIASSGSHRLQLATRSAQLYERAFCLHGRYFPAINAASMYLLADRPDDSQRLARQVIALCERIEPKEDHSYYVAATRAEAYLLLGQLDSMQTALEEAARHATDVAAVASTRHQLLGLCAQLNVPPSLLNPLQPPSVIHFTGHMMRLPAGGGRLLPEHLPEITRQVIQFLTARRVGYGYGSLACGADIIIAEALLERGAELHVVLPFRQQDFEQISVVSGGDEWGDRFHHCLERAAKITYATEGSYLGDGSIFAYAARIAMGLAQLQARRLEAEIEQLAVWDGKTSESNVGTAGDVAFWQQQGLKTTAIACSPNGDCEATVVFPPLRSKPARERHLQAILLGDFQRFSRLEDEYQPTFVTHVLSAMGRVVARYKSVVRYCNTQGDGLLLILDNVEHAARCALDLQRAVQQLDLAALGLPEDLLLRIGCHLGPVYQMEDPITHVPAFFGAHITRAARIEPVTPPDAVYVSEAFASSLAFHADAFVCEYVGEVPSAKNYGAMRMYWLRERQPLSDDRLNQS